MVAPDGAQIGVKDTDEALWLAEQLGMDLVEVAPGSDPPVARLMDYGKYKYEQSVKARESRKKQTRTVIKEVKFKTKIDPHDYQTKVRRAASFLEEGHRVKTVVMFFGREITHPERGRDLMERMIEQLEGTAIVESAPRLEGRNMTMLLAPDKAGIAAAAKKAKEEAAAADSLSEQSPSEDAATTSAAAEDTKQATTESTRQATRQREEDAETEDPQGSESSLQGDRDREAPQETPGNESPEDEQVEPPEAAANG